ncbi:uncharacterized protein LOC108105179 [Drosophila eugracilis]|uniref:uncharacterized protein LOC108105179 n=1 Tax=Drosophila eugracilis TaxID=29029 RepID=UPI0007E60817|nr:uncharacterized protein LOC108105179 [Drosophila eugracilis]
MFLQCHSVAGGSQTNIHSTSELNTDISLGEGTGYRTSNESIYGPSDRLQVVLLDYKQFKAARTIQRYVRGYLTRKHIKREKWAVSTISKWWRRFWVQRSMFSRIQQLLQQRIIQYHNNMATKIQALFRGWMTRQYFQDFQGMKSLRMQYAEDMLSLLYRKLYWMRKDHLLPGIYALRESDLLLKIENLSDTFGFRFHNGRVRATIAQKRTFINDRRVEFQKSSIYSSVPYPGPYLDGIPTFDLNLPKNLNPRLQRIVLMYDKSMRDKYVKKVYMNFSTKRRINMNVLRENKRTRFCKDFAKRVMANKDGRRKRTENIIQVFLDALLAAADEYNCFCKPQVTDDSLCQ